MNLYGSRSKGVLSLIKCSIHNVYLIDIIRNGVYNSFSSFQNGLTAPHMLGNQLNPTSTMHSKMNEHLNSEMEAHSIFNPNENSSNLVGPPLQHKIIQSVS